ncbi:sorting nexin 10 S homeolog [Xenopus laevis]|uniref:MGC84638 protein n=1 Tax=Xenopus laevis TaxID=8355 RepID=Q6DF72_XENLA|nr:sorting nexin 10 S homeolog [Xenopus laevis]AAH76870.1 MGC84638 protein [Xenopus laevis]
MLPRDHEGETISVWVRDPKVQKEDWHSYVDYEICLHTNSMCFTLKTSCVRRRFREFVWLRQKLQNNAVLTQLPELPPRIPFFKIRNSQNLEQRVRGLQEFLNNLAQKKLMPAHLEKQNIPFLKPFTSSPTQTGGFLWKRKRRKQTITRIPRVHPLSLDTSVMVISYTDAM